MRAEPNALGQYLRDRRARLDPAAFGVPLSRRRTPGLRREEVAQRANVSATWYTWLEQGRGGAPSASVLDRIAQAMLLTDVEREHMYLLALGRPPEVRYQGTSGVSPRLQRVLDALGTSPAVIKTSTCDVLAWNQAALAILGDYRSMPPEERNILRMIFLDPQARIRQPNWDAVARFCVASFRTDVIRAGAADNVRALIEELSRLSPEFEAMWRENDVRGPHGDQVKHIRHPEVGMIAFEHSAFAVDGRPDLTLMVFNPASADDIKSVRLALERSAGAGAA